MTYLTKFHLQLKIKPTSESIYYQAGQYIFLKYPRGNFLPFSLASAPNLSKEIELHVRIADKDFATLEFTNQFCIGYKLILAGPYGECTYQESSDTILLLAAGTGFAPAKAILEEIINCNINRSCHLFWIAKYDSDFYLKNFLSHCNLILPKFKSTLMTTQTSDSKGTQVTKELFIKNIVAHYPFADKLEVYVFGPRTLAIETWHQLKARGLKPEKYHSDMFSVNEE